MLGQLRGESLDEWGGASLRETPQWNSQGKLPRREVRPRANVHGRRVMGRPDMITGEEGIAETWTLKAYARASYPRWTDAGLDLRLEGLWSRDRCWAARFAYTDLQPICLWECAWNGHCAAKRADVRRSKILSQGNAPSFTARGGAPPQPICAQDMPPCLKGYTFLNC